ncbi:MAG: hypothetical protein KDI13_03640 [Alphaproteobacteria bacterium]|nr:hypothetical protein [Alphaproteobacteria bacterium]
MENKKSESPVNAKSKKPVRSPTSDVAGILVMAVAMAVLAGVGTLAWFKYFAPVNQATPAGQNDTVATCPDCAKPPPPQKTILPQEQTKLVNPGQESFSGLWKTKAGGRTAFIVFTKNLFRITLLDDEKGNLRRYSSGNFTYEPQTGILHLMPSRHMPAPKASPDITYDILTLRAFDITARQESGKPAIYWLATNDQILLKRVHPLFFYSGDGQIPVLKWEKTESPKKPDKPPAPTSAQPAVQAPAQPPASGQP